MAKKAKKETGGEVRESARKIWLAGLGALSLAEAEGSKVFKRLVKEGEGFEAKSRARASRLADGIEEVRGKAGQAVDERISTVLHRMGVPTRDEIRTLTRKIEQLAAGVDKLKAKGRSPARRKAAAPETAPEA